MDINISKSIKLRISEITIKKEKSITLNFLVRIEETICLVYRV